MIHIIFKTKLRLTNSTIRQLATKTEPFGSLSHRGRLSLNVTKVETQRKDDSDNYDVEEFDMIPRKTFHYYDREISKYARQGKNGLQHALKLFATMKAQDRLTPAINNFSPLIYGCAKAGNTKKAFELYRESLRYTNKPTKSVVTCLINSCAESPFKEYGIKKLDWFREHLKFEYNYQFNDIQYRSTIKAYGKLGRLEEANKVFKEMIDNGILPDAESFNMLLIGCASNKKLGAVLALRVYKRMRQYSIKPNLITFRLMLRCIRDCEFGSVELLSKTISELPATTNYEQKLSYKRLANKGHHRKNSMQNFEWLPLISDLSDSVERAIDTKTLESLDKEDNQQSDIKLLESGNKNQSDIIEISSNLPSEILVRHANDNRYKLPNLLLDDHLQQISKIQAIQASSLNDPKNRLLLFGGIHGFLDMMTKEGCKPDEKTFNLLLDCLKNDKITVMEFYRLAMDHNIKRDLLFYDLLIRHICDRYNDPDRLRRALTFIDEMQKDNIRPNISTFEELASGCDTWKMAKNLIMDVEKCGFTISFQMIRRFFKVALKKSDLIYLSNLIKFSRSFNFEPTKKLVDELEYFRLKERNRVLQYEQRKKDNNVAGELIDESYVKMFDRFSKILGWWLKNVNLYEEEHPWAQFQYEQPAKSSGFRDFVAEFRKLEKLKREKMKHGLELGNLVTEACKEPEELIVSKKKTNG